MPLRTEGGIAQTRAAGCESFTATITSTIARRTIAKLATWFAIATTPGGGRLGTFLARSVVAAHGHHRTGGGFGFGRGFGNRRLGLFCNGL
jgi:hypothetical protein